MRRRWALSLRSPVAETVLDAQVVGGGDRMVGVADPAMLEVDPPPSAADLAPRIHIGMEWRSRGQIEMERRCPCRIGKEAKVQAKDVMALTVAVAVPMEEAEVQVEEVAMLAVEVAVPTEEIMAPSRGVCAYDGGGGGHCDGGAAHGATEWRRHRAWAAPAFLRRERRRG